MTCKFFPSRTPITASFRGRRNFIAISTIFVVTGALLAITGRERAAAGPDRVRDASAIADQQRPAAPAVAPAANLPALKYASLPDAGKAAISGTSTLHDWTVTTTKIDGRAAFSGEWDGKAIALGSIDLSIPVDSLKSTEGGGMDNTMYDALNLKKFPTIVYKLTSATLKSSPSKESAAYHFNATGQLTVSGNAHPLDLDLSVTPDAGGKLTIVTDARLKMTDFGVKPPTAMFGMIKSGDAITVKVTWQVAKQP